MPERASGVAYYWKAKGTKSDRIKCGLREVRKQYKFTTDLAPELAKAPAPNNLSPGKNH